MPRWRSHVRSSNPFSGPRGAARTPSASRTSPWAGARPAGSSSRIGSVTRSAPKRWRSPCTRMSKRERRGGAVTTTCARSAVPRSRVRGLRSIASSRTPPHHQPARTAASATGRSRCSGSTSTASRDEPAVRLTSARPWMRATFAAETPQQAAPRSTCGAGSRASTGLTGRPSPCSWSSLAGPMPEMASSSSTEWNAPCSCPVVDDLLSRHGTDSRQRVELLLGRGAQADRPRRRPGRHRQAPRRRPRRPLPGAARRPARRPRAAPRG